MTPTPFPLCMFGHPALKRTARDVKPDELGSAPLASMAETMTATMRRWDGVGIAAPQVAINLRLVVITPKTAPVVLVNPYLVALEETPTDDERMEGCLSVPGCTFNIARPRTVHVRALDLDGNELDVEYRGFAARQVCHELDHLDGTLVLDRAHHDARAAYLRAFRLSILGAPQLAHLARPLAVV